MLILAKRVYNLVAREARVHGIVTFVNKVLTEEYFRFLLHLLLQNHPT